MLHSSGERARFTIERSINPSAAEIERIRAGLSAFNRSQIPDKGYVPLLMNLLAEDGSFSGGLSGHISYGWLFVDILWVADHARSQGHGRGLMLAAEEEARKRGCQHAWVDTFSFQARRFYERLGYVVFGELDEYPPGHSRFFLRKALTEARKNDGALR
jgi:GNAT superfamily N-acetyltransferase